MNTKTTLHFGIRRGAVPGYLFEGLFTFVGIVLLGVGFFLSINSHVFMASAAPAEAVILTMHSAGDGRPGTPLVEYVADGRRYVERLDTGTSEMMPGRHITVHYNRRNPRDVRYTKDDGWRTASVRRRRHRLHGHGRRRPLREAAAASPPDRGGAPGRRHEPAPLTRCPPTLCLGREKHRRDCFESIKPR